jgi:hypothetical protein
MTIIEIGVGQIFGASCYIEHFVIVNVVRGCWAFVSDYTNFGIILILIFTLYRHHSFLSKSKVNGKT